MRFLVASLVTAGIAVALAILGCEQRSAGDLLGRTGAAPGVANPMPGTPLVDAGAAISPSVTPVKADGEATPGGCPGSAGVPENTASPSYPQS